MKWNPISEAPKRSGVYFVYAPSLDPKRPFFHVAYYDAESGWSGLVPVWLKALTHWMEPVPPTPFDRGSFEAMDDESRANTKSPKPRVCEKCGYPGFVKDEDDGRYQCRSCGLAWPHPEPPVFMVVERTHFCETGNDEFKVKEYRDSAEGFIW